MSDAFQISVWPEDQVLLSSRRAGSSRVLHPRKSKLCEVKYRTISSKGQVLTNILFLFSKQGRLRFGSNCRGKTRCSQATCRHETRLRLSSVRSKNESGKLCAIKCQWWLRNCHIPDFSPGQPEDGTGLRRLVGASNCVQLLSACWWEATGIRINSTPKPWVQQSHLRRVHDEISWVLKRGRRCHTDGQLRVR